MAIPEKYGTKYWSTWLGMGSLWLITRLPYHWQMWIGTQLGRILYRFATKRRPIAETNIRLCFPDLSPREQTRLCKDVFIAQGLGIIETGLAWWGEDEVLKHRYQVEGIEHYEAALAQGRGVLVLGAHFSNLDLAGRLTSFFMDLDVIYRHQNNKVIHDIMVGARDKTFTNAYERSETRKILRALKKGRSVWYAADQDYGRRHSVFAPFFGIPAATITASSRLAGYHDTPVLMLSHYRTDDKQQHLFAFSPVLENYASGNDVDDATRVNQLLEQSIKRFPAQYLWLHRRFKTRPEGEQGFYPKRKKRKKK